MMTNIKNNNSNGEMYYIIPLTLLLVAFLYSPIGKLAMQNAIDKIPEHKPVGYYYYQSLEEQGVDTNQLPSWYKNYRK